MRRVPLRPSYDKSVELNAKQRYIEETFRSFFFFFFLLGGLCVDVLSLSVDQAGFSRRTLLLSYLLFATYS